MRIALDLFELGEKMLRQSLRRKHPDASEAEIEAAVAEWRLRRPGAELGDAPGRLRPWPRA
jgi:Rv0078B-related antitoxin